MRSIGFIFLVISLSIFISCNRDDKPTPAYEFTGAGIFMCKVNGAEFDVEGLCGSNRATFENSNFLTARGVSKCNESTIIVTVFTGEGGKVKIGNYDITPSSSVFPRGGGVYSTTYEGCYFSGSRERDVIDGEMDIQFLGRKEIDGQERKIVGGAFHFRTRVGNCELIEVTEGFFDLQYIGTN